MCSRTAGLPLLLVLLTFTRDCTSQSSSAAEADSIYHPSSSSSSLAPLWSSSIVPSSPKAEEAYIEPASQSRAPGSYSSSVPLSIAPQNVQVAAISSSPQPVSSVSSSTPSGQIALNEPRSSSSGSIARLEGASSSISLASTFSTATIHSSSISSASTLSNLSSSSRANSTASSCAATAFPTVPSEGTGTSYAQACASEWEAWKGFRPDMVPCSYPHATYTNTDIDREIIYTGAVSTACGSIVYGVNGDEYYSTTHTITKVVTKRPGLPEPTCKVSPAECAYLHSSYRASYSVWEKGAASLSEPHEPAFCSVTTRECGKCTIMAKEAKLLYFPVPSTSRDMCASQPTAFVLPTRAANLSGPIASMVYEGQTLYADKVYVSYDRVSAVDQCDGVETTIGNVHAGSIVSMASASLSSVRYPNLGDAYPFNYGDLNWPVPWSAYYGQKACFWGYCLTVLNDYSPILVVPPEVRALDPAWADCALDWEGTFDPPTALVTADALVKAESTPGPQPAAVAAAPNPEQTPANAPQNPPADPPANPPVVNPQATPTDTGFLIPGLPGVLAPTATDPLALTIADINGQVLAVDLAGEGAVVIGEQTLTLGAVATIAGAVVSVGRAAVQVGTSIIALPIALITPAAAPAVASGIVVSGANGGITVLQDAAGNAVVAGTTISAGGAAVTVNGQVISAAVGGADIGGSALQFSSLGPTTTVFTVNGQAITAAVQAGNGDAIVVGSQTLSVGGTAATVNGRVISAAPAGLVVDGRSTFSISGQEPRTTDRSKVSDFVASGLGFHEDPVPSPSAASRLDVAALGASTSPQSSGCRRDRWPKSPWMISQGLLALMVMMYS